MRLNIPHPDRTAEFAALVARHPTLAAMGLDARLGGNWSLFREALIGMDPEESRDLALAFCDAYHYHELLKKDDFRWEVGVYHLPPQLGEFGVVKLKLGNCKICNSTLARKP